MINMVPLRFDGFLTKAADSDARHHVTLSQRLMRALWVMQMTGLF